ncbi:MAG: hypothetical protein ACLTEH_02230 [Clostridia bacterium]
MDGHFCPFGTLIEKWGRNEKLDLLKKKY